MSPVDLLNAPLIECFTQTMRQTLRVAVLASALAVAAPAAGASADGDGGGASGGGGGTIMAFSQISRICDFSEINYRGPWGVGRPIAVLRSDGSTVSADIQIATARPNFPYDVRLIQVPRPSSATCWGGDPGVALAKLHTDGAGAGAVTLQGTIEPGATGAWIWISRPDPFSQDPAEFYTTDFIAPI
jgi:hypothetical protein